MDDHADWRLQLDSHALLAMFLLTLVATHFSVILVTRLMVAGLTFGVLVYPPLKHDRYTWFLMAAFLTTNLLDNYWVAANHYFLACYVTLAMALLTATAPAVRAERECVMARDLLLLVMALAVVHKVINPAFLSGEMFADFIYRGEMLRPQLSRLFEGFPALLSANHAAFEATASSFADGTGAVLSVAGGPPLWLSPALAWFILVSEVLVLALVLLFPRHTLTALMLLGFVWGTYFLRSEPQFLALVSFLGFLMVGDRQPRSRVAFALSMLAMLSFEISNARPPGMP